MSDVLAITLNPAIDLSVGVTRLAPGTVHRADSVASRAAGKGHNVAEVLAGLGHAVTVAGFIGAANAPVFAAALAERGIVDGCTRVSGETRTNIKIGEADGRVSDINTPGTPITAADWARLRADTETRLMAAPRAVVIAGSLPPGVTPAHLAGLIQQAAALGVPVWLDTSGAALSVGVAAGCALAKPNDDELAAWAGAALEDERALINAARTMQRAGAAEVVVSRGGSRLFWQTENGRLMAEPPRVDAVSTVGAGDTLLAGLLHGRLCGWADIDTLAFAAALAADAVTRIGVGRADGPQFAAWHAAVRVTDSNDPVAPVAARGTSA